MSLDLTSDDLRNAAEMVRAAQPLLERLGSLVRRMLPAREAGTQPDAIEAQIVETLEEISAVPAQQRKLARSLNTLFLHYDIASKLRTECDKCFELTTETQHPEDLLYFWREQVRMTAGWDERATTLLRAIDGARLPMKNLQAMPLLQTASRSFRTNHTKMLGVLDGPERDLQIYRIHLRDIKSSLLQIESELKHAIHDLISDLGYGES